MYIPRIIPLASILERKSVLLLGPRQTGKSTYIRHALSADRVYNLLFADQFLKLSGRPSLIREELEGHEKLIVIDEIQKLPILMDEVHAMMEEKKIRFLLTGSSARKLKQTHTSLLGGRAKTMYLFPFTFAEMQPWNLGRVLTFGALPPIVMSKNPWDDLNTYVGNYLREEIVSEALVRKVESFSRFLHTAALGNGEVINFTSVGSDAQVPPRTIREYYHILEDTLMGTLLSPFVTSGPRKAISHGKFYFFDIGVVHTLLGQLSLGNNPTLIGRALEHLVFLELKAYVHYHQRDEPIRFWRTHEKQEVDFIVGDRIAIEVKATSLVQEKHLKGLEALSQDARMKRLIVVSQDSRRRRIGKIEIIPIATFLKDLWDGAIVS